MNPTDLRLPGYMGVLPFLVGNRLAVHYALSSYGAATPKELALRMGWDKTSVRPRISELREKGWVQETGKRRNGEHEFIAIYKVQQLELLSA